MYPSCLVVRPMTPKGPSVSAKAPIRVQQPQSPSVLCHFGLRLVPDGLYGKAFLHCKHKPSYDPLTLILLSHRSGAAAPYQPSAPCQPSSPEISLVERAFRPLPLCMHATLRRKVPKGFRPCDFFSLAQVAPALPRPRSFSAGKCGTSRVLTCKI